MTKQSLGLAGRLARFEHWLGILEQALMFALLLFMVALGAGGYIYHLITRGSIPHGEVLIRYAVFSMAMIGGAFAARHGRLLSMDAVTHVLSSRGVAILRVVTTVFAIAMTLVLLWFTWRLFIRVRAEPSHGVPPWVPAAFMPLGLGLLLLHLVCHLVQAADAVRTGRALPRGEP